MTDRETAHPPDPARAVLRLSLERRTLPPVDDRPARRGVTRGRTKGIVSCLNRHSTRVAPDTRVLAWKGCSVEVDDKVCGVSGPAMISELASSMSWTHWAAAGVLPNSLSIDEAVNACEVVGFEVPDFVEFGANQWPEVLWVEEIVCLR